MLIPYIYIYYSVLSVCAPYYILSNTFFWQIHDLIKVDTGTKDCRLVQPWKPVRVRGQRKESKDPSPIPLCDTPPSPVRPQRLSVSVNTSNTQYLHKTQRTHNCLPLSSFLLEKEIWIPPKGQSVLKFPWLSRALLFDFSQLKSLLLGENCVVGSTLWNKVQSS